MRKSENIFLFIVLSLLFSSCEEVIDIDLDQSEKHIVIEAKLHEGYQVFSVFASYSFPYFNNKLPEVIENAEISISNNQGFQIEVPYREYGLYQVRMEGVAGNTYTLKVNIDDRTYVAESYLPPKVQLDSLFYEYEDGKEILDEGYYVHYEFTDPKGIDNYYRSTYYLNGLHSNSADDLRVYFDDSFDGNNIERLVTFDPFEVNDTITLELIHFDKASYDYFSTLGDFLGGVGGAAPANPISPWSGDALGYFSAYSSDRLSIIIQPE